MKKTTDKTITAKTENAKIKLCLQSFIEILVTPNCWSNPPKFFSQKIWAEVTIEDILRLISTSRLNALPHLHLKPINLVISQEAI
ncbi:MAG: hypothetical protein UX02_C0002G0421 [Candidatus Moranbacteria bacterium GW2011_GWC1_45_18]|nr:MAG: hypothetical protein UT79_C0001G0040 [Candidatus Moranbacteria bacterium GW2011_GWC2_40_12]KKT32696.1 MAG: hypothetical protein UW19_C0017G0034 [Candidatus Moranbacteria bacterium GW2011_GWF2_44_10]KKU00178.1 MAG: hypothetical protein UX02_C0002G0421 [Candidatus Moranbacteria bacterium GW2011_GWC1_45_18]HBB37215.1 hypothetical protein [Candidatus Moranbacteria bacterium]HBU24766.1 hypothetical protein [Candidatus Moranbacteria bacterium]